MSLLTLVFTLLFYLATATLIGGLAWRIRLLRSSAGDDRGAGCTVGDRSEPEGELKRRFLELWTKHRGPCDQCRRAAKQARRCHVAFSAGYLFLWRENC